MFIFLQIEVCFHYILQSIRNMSICTMVKCFKGGAFRSFFLAKIRKQIVSNENLL